MFILKRHEISLHPPAYSGMSGKIPNSDLFTRMFIGGPGSVVGIELATGWTVRGSNCGGGKIFRTCPDRSWGPPSSCTMDTGSFPGVNSDRGVTLTPHPLPVLWSFKGCRIPPLGVWAVGPVQSLSACSSVHVTLQYSYTSTPPMDRTACTEPQCLYKGDL
jgi:hypothetical protein